MLNQEARHFLHGVEFCVINPKVAIFLQQRVRVFKINKARWPAVAAVDQSKIQNRAGKAFIYSEAWQNPLRPIDMLFNRVIGYFIFSAEIAGTFKELRIGRNTYEFGWRKKQH